MVSANGVLPWTTQLLGIQATWYPGGCVPSHLTSLIAWTSMAGVDTGAGVAVAFGWLDTGDEAAATGWLAAGVDPFRDSGTRMPQSTAAVTPASPAIRCRRRRSSRRPRARSSAGLACSPVRGMSLRANSNKSFMSFTG